jgi:hypothetical protein
MILVDVIVMFILKHKKHNTAPFSFCFCFIVLINTMVSFKEKL